MTVCIDCGSEHWIAVEPGSDEIRFGSDPKVPLLHPIAAVEARAWCADHWPWGKVMAKPLLIHLLITKAEAQHIFDTEPAPNAKHKNGGFQILRRYVADQLAMPENRTIEGKYWVSFDDVHLHRLIRIMGYTCPGGYQSHARSAFRRALSLHCAGMHPVRD